MPDDVARSFARCAKGLVVGPAGCGKTHLIAESVGHAPGAQLVLTHTHAGVDALRAKLGALGVPSAKYRVTTIDSLALCYAKAFPRLGGWAGASPGGDKEWSALRVAASRLFRCRAPRRVLRASYAGMFVDEYQDCCGTQHEMIAAIAEAIPCRVVGDPLQAIYRKLHGNDIARWSDVEGTFPVVGVLTEPHRWRKGNAKLGEWLGDLRAQLVDGAEVDFAGARGIVRWIPSADPQQQVAACHRTSDVGGVVAICDWPERCAAIARKTRNHFTVLESVECPDLLRAAEDIGNSHGLDRVACVVGLAQRCHTGMSGLTGLLARMKRGETYSARSTDKVRLWAAMKGVAESDDLRAVENMMLTIDGLSDTHFWARRELWREMRRTLQVCDSGSGRGLREAAWALRDRARRNGRRILSRCTVATPLLIKGLEFDHALLLDAMGMRTAEELYVALTRGSSSLTVLSSQPRLRLSVPAWLKENTSQAQSVE